MTQHDVAVDTSGSTTKQKTIKTELSFAGNITVHGVALDTSHSVPPQKQRTKLWFLLHLLVRRREQHRFSMAPGNQWHINTDQKEPKKKSRT